MVVIKIKNAGKVYDIEVDDSANGLEFKNAIAAKTNIPVDKQKILIKGGKLNDDSVLKDLKFTQPIMVLGTANNNINSIELPKTVFLEDLNQNELIKVSDEPSGLLNLGNTCYFNSSLQAIYHIPDIKNRLEENNSNNSFVGALKRLFALMQKKQEKINPNLFLMNFRDNFPQFSERDNHGFYKQQDAEESFSQILSLLIDDLKIRDLFRVQFNVETKCLAQPDDLAVSSEEALKLMCHIDIKTNFLRDGLLGGLTETIEKFNDTLQSNTDYQVTKKIIRTPKYLIIHFVRFFWKTDVQKKSKILRKVQFPFELDISEMLDDSIKSTKTKFRDDFRKIEKSNDDLMRDFKKAKKDTALTPLQQQEEDKLKYLSIKSKFEDDYNDLLASHNIDKKIEELTENPSSIYSLNSVITHQGSSADSGHYQCFSKDEEDDNTWWKFNDDKISKIDRERVEQLSGGGESDSALLLVYKATGL
ncbi:ubiquitin carboxyl-terminal hydrolase 6 [[Candida] jaroonii]|uniref:Ubiquitin carboxyl-terminal hydrolase 6 n=1 Tax=[Candida] jaroonii TaxID=467808 RepID=A0ACA9Y114_9ASCO|nr:ubiquitin carboxyl-terminal hydrolase 6 [[Candida] jaroonii]